MKTVASALGIALLLTACGGPSDTIEGDLAAASEIIEIPAAAAEPVARDRYGFTSPNSEATIDVFDVPADVADRYDVFTAPRRDVIEFVRNPVSLGALANVLDPADSIVAILIPLLDPTQDLGVDFDAFFIALDGSGRVVAADYPDATVDRLNELFEFGREAGYPPAEILAIAARGIISETPTAREEEAAAIVLGG